MTEIHLVWLLDYNIFSPVIFKVKTSTAGKILTVYTFYTKYPEHPNYLFNSVMNSLIIVRIVSDVLLFCLLPVVLSNVQHVLQVADVTNSESQDFNLGQLFVWWQRREKFPQLRKGHVEGHDPDPLPGRMRRTIPGGGAPPVPPLLPGERAAVSAAAHELDWHGARRTCLRFLLSPQMDRFLRVKTTLL